MLKRTSFLITAICFLSISIRAQDNCFKVDLQAVSISPAALFLGKGKTMEVEVVMQNNGPCPIPKGDATAQITISSEHIELAKPLGFKDACSQWTLVKTSRAGSNYNLFFKNMGGVLPVGGSGCAFRFSVKGVSDSPGISRMTLASSLSATAMTADMDGNNQSAYAEIQLGEIKDISAISPGELDLTATSSNCYANLLWKMDAGIEKFEVEQSPDGVVFKRLTTISPKDKTPNGYEYAVEQGAGKKYYRVKLIYDKGDPLYSKNVEVETRCTPKKGFAP